MYDASGIRLHAGRQAEVRKMFWKKIIKILDGLWLYIDSTETIV